MLLASIIKLHYITKRHIHEHRLKISLKGLYVHLKWENVIGVLIILKKR